MIRSIAIDDEPLALKQVAKYIEQTPFLELAGQFHNPFKALTFIQENEVDLIFIDINMPDLNGVDFVKSLNNPPKIIFITAYSEYAIDGFKLNATDYLLKPIGYSDFLKSANKAKDQISYSTKELDPNSNKSINSEVNKNSSLDEITTSDSDYMFIKSEYKVLKVELSQIRFIESMREYLSIDIYNSKPIMTLMSMKKMEEHLSEKGFMRVHRSFIVNLNRVETVERNRIVFDKSRYIPISEQYKVNFNKFLDEKLFK